VHRKCLCLAKKRGKSKGKQDMTYSKRQSDMGVHGAVHLIFKEANNRYIQPPLLELTRDINYAAVKIRSIRCRL
jgi:hypothetical protein